MDPATDSGREEQEGPVNICPVCAPNPRSHLNPICNTCRARVRVGRPIVYRGDRWDVTRISDLGNGVGPVTLRDWKGRECCMAYSLVSEKARAWDTIVAAAGGTP